LVSLKQYPLFPGGFGRKFKCSLLLQKADTAGLGFPGLGGNGKSSKHFVAFTLINCQHIKSISKHFSLHTTATSLDLPEPFLFAKFHFF